LKQKQSQFFLGFWIQKNVLFPSPRVSSFSSSRALNAKQYRIRIVVPVAFTLAKIVASTKVKGKKEL